MGTRVFDRVFSLRRCRRGYRPFHSNVIGVAAGEAPFVLDGLAGNAAEFDPLVHHVGTRRREAICVSQKRCARFRDRSNR